MCINVLSLSAVLGCGLPPVPPVESRLYLAAPADPSAPVPDGADVTYACKDHGRFADDEARGNFVLRCQKDTAQFWTPGEGLLIKDWNFPVCKPCECVLRTVR